MCFFFWCRKRLETDDDDETKKLDKPRATPPSFFAIETELDSRFSAAYNPQDNEYWGLGLENECYLQSARQLEYDTKSVLDRRLSRERYSVNYMDTYHDVELRETLRRAWVDIPRVSVPQLLNSHAFTKMDRHGEPIRTYTRDPQPNPKFSGKTLFEEWTEYDPYLLLFVNDVSKERTPVFFDGDSIEFVTTHFYRATTAQVSDELIATRDAFLRRFHAFLRHQGIFASHLPFRFVEWHPGLAAMMTQPHRLVPFNNTTLHVHLTLPSALHNGQLVDPIAFERQHQQVATVLQWFEPYFIGQLGSPDFLHNWFAPGTFAAGSQRAAIGRYISVGTFDPDRMKRGTVQTVSVDDARPRAPVRWWRDRIESTSQYRLSSDQIGIDIHFAKHYQCGLELRWFDGIPVTHLKSLLDHVVLIAAYALQVPFRAENVASRSQEWNDFVYDSLMHGADARMTDGQQAAYVNLLGFAAADCPSTSTHAFFAMLFQQMQQHLVSRIVLEKLSPDFELRTLPDINRQQKHHHTYHFIQKN